MNKWYGNSIFAGKNLLKTKVLLENESGSNAILNLGTQAVLTGQPQTACQIAAAIDSVTPNDVRSVSLSRSNILIFIISNHFL